MNLEPDECTKLTNTIIIHSDVNKLIDFNLVHGQFTQIIFSDYVDINYCIKKLIPNYIDVNVNEYIKKLTQKSAQSGCDCGKYFENKSIFNHPIILTDDITHLIFGYEFNQDVNFSNSRLQYLTFGFDFNKSVYIPNSLIYLNVSRSFNRMLKMYDFYHFV